MYACSGQRSTDPKGSGRFCPKSGRPSIECIGARQGSCRECKAHLPPDAILASRVPRKGKALPRIPIGLPHAFSASSGETLDSLIVERLQRIFPETDAHEALLYLEDASLALSLSRSYQGIASSSSKDLVPFFDMALLGPLPEKQMSILEDAIKAEKEKSVGHAGVTMKAQRVKGVFHLLNAAALRHRPRPSSATA